MVMATTSTKKAPSRLSALIDTFRPSVRPHSLEALNPDTRRALARLHRAPSEIAELAIATMGYWVRVGLANEKIIKPFDTSGSADAKEHPAHVVITPHGRRVIAACAKEFAEDADDFASSDFLRRQR